MNPYAVEEINSDNRRPGMKHQEGFLVRYRPHASFGWTGCRTFSDRDGAESFAANDLKPEGDLKDAGK
jgi:hypothetical protein